MWWPGRTQKRTQKRTHNVVTWWPGRRVTWATVDVDDGGVG